MISIENPNPKEIKGVGRKKIIFFVLILFLFISSTILITNTHHIKIQSGVSKLRKYLKQKLYPDECFPG